MDNGILSWTAPHSEQVLLDGNHRSATTTRPPRRSALYSSCLRNSKKLMSAMDRARRRFFSIPCTFRLSIPMVSNRPVRSVVSLCKASCRILAIRAWSRDSLALAFFAFSDTVDALLSGGAHRGSVPFSPLRPCACATGFWITASVV